MTIIDAGGFAIHVVSREGRAKFPSLPGQNNSGTFCEHPFAVTSPFPVWLEPAQSHRHQSLVIAPSAPSATHDEHAPSLPVNLCDGSQYFFVQDQK